MKAEIDELGTLTIKAESALESYVIQKWVDKNWPTCGDGIRTDNLQFDWNVEKQYRRTPKGKAEILKFYYEWLNIPSEKQPSFDSFIMCCDDNN